MKAAGWANGVGTRNSTVEELKARRPKLMDVDRLRKKGRIPVVAEKSLGHSWKKSMPAIKKYKSKSSGGARKVK